jgi:hypothetical protein
MFQVHLDDRGTPGNLTPLLTSIFISLLTMRYIFLRASCSILNRPIIRQLQQPEPGNQEVWRTAE